MCSYRAEENQNHWMVWLGKELKIVQLQAPWHSKGHLSLEQVAQSPIQPGFEHFLGEASTAINISKLDGKKVMPDSFRGQNKDCCVETKIQKVPPQSLHWGWQEKAANGGHVVPLFEDIKNLPGYIPVSTDQNPPPVLFFSRGVGLDYF